MNLSRAVSVSAEAPRDRWMDACGAAAFVSFLLIVGYVAFPPIAGLSMPYSGGGAVVLGIGATLCLGLKSASARLAASIALAGLMILRTFSSIRPDIFVAEHGELSGCEFGFGQVRRPSGVCSTSAPSGLI
jgi:hypothetical protein